MLRGRATVYARAGRRASVWSFLSRGYWRRLAERPALLFAAWALLLVPALLGAVWGLVDAPAAAGLIPAEFQSAADPPVEGRDFDAETASAFSFQVMFNNIQVTLLAFVGGITFGALTVWALFFNGLILGVIAGPGDRRRQRDRVPAADLLARAAGDLVHRVSAVWPGCGSAGR